MTNVAKYNACKGVSTGLTFGAPLITAACMGGFFKQQPSTAISGAAVFAILLAALLAKDKIAEKFKAPSALIVAIAAFVFCLIVESILYPVKVISCVTIIACGVDELTFKHIYKIVELKLPQQAQGLKKFGFFAAKQTTIDGLSGDKVNETV